jgi:hypothetical protein
MENITTCGTSAALSANTKYTFALLVYTVIITIALILNSILLFIVIKVKTIERVTKICLLNVSLSYMGLALTGLILQILILTSLPNDVCYLQVTL